MFTFLLFPFHHRPFNNRWWFRGHLSVKATLWGSCGQIEHIPLKEGNHTGCSKTYELSAIFWKYTNTDTLWKLSEKQTLQLPFEVHSKTRPVLACYFISSSIKEEVIISACCCMVKYVTLFFCFKFDENGGLLSHFSQFPWQQTRYLYFFIRTEGSPVQYYNSQS